MVSVPKVSVSEIESFGIDLNYSGLYSESLICNGTNSDIMVIGNNNNRTFIAPDPRNNNGFITIFRRSHNGSRQQYTSKGSEAVRCKTTKYEIDKIEIEKGYYYHKETDLVIATINVGTTIKHPNAKKDYDETLKDVHQCLLGKKSTTVTFSVNDPLNRIQEIYGCIGGHCFKIKCINMPHKGACTLHINLCDGETVTTHEDIIIEDLITTGVFTCNAFDKMVSLGLTAAEALSQYDHMREQERIDLELTVNKRVIEQRKNADKKQALDTEQHEILTRELKRDKELANTKLKVAQEELEKTKLDLQAKSALLDEWESLREFKSAKDKRDIELSMLQSKDREQDHKTERAKLSSNEETIKIVGGVAALIISAVIGAVIKAAMQPKK